MAQQTAHGSENEPLLRYLSRLTPASRQSTAHYLDVVAAALSGGRCLAEQYEWTAFSPRDTSRLRTLLAGRYGPSAVSKMVTAVRGVLQECLRLGVIDARQYMRLSHMPRSRQLRQLTISDVEVLFSVCFRTPTRASARNLVSLALLYGLGLTLSQAVMIKMEDYDRMSNSLTIPGTGREVFLNSSLRTAFNTWLLARGAEAGSFLCPINKGDIVDVRPFTVQALGKALARLGVSADITSLTPEQLIGIHRDRVSRQPGIPLEIPVR